MVSPRRSAVWIALGVLIPLLISACGKPKGVPENESPEAKRLKQVFDLCNAYKAATKKQPTKIDEVKAWAVKAEKASAEDFISPRDQEAYGIALNPMGGVIVYEQKGIGGKRFILQMGRVFEESSESVDSLIEQFKGISEQMGGRGGAGTKKGGK